MLLITHLNKQFIIYLPFQGILNKINGTSFRMDMQTEDLLLKD